jgi:hypothetical protein
MDARDNIPDFDPALGLLFFDLGRSAAYTLGRKFRSLLGGEVAFMDIPVSHICSRSHTAQRTFNRKRGWSAIAKPL